MEPISLVPFAFGAGWAGNFFAATRAETEEERQLYGFVSTVMLIAAAWWILMRGF